MTPSPPRPGTLLGAALLLAIASIAGSAHAGTQSVDGLLGQDDSLFVRQFDLVQNDVLSVATFAYGGLQSPGRSIPPGGFAPVLALFQDGVGLLQLARGTDNLCSSLGSGAADPVSGFCWDAHFTLVGVNAGHYTLVLSQDGNDPLGQRLADGYSQAGIADYTSVYNGVPGAHFIQVDGAQRNGHFALDISAPNSPAVPEPAAALLLAAGLAGLAGWRATHRRRSGLTGATGASHR